MYVGWGTNQLRYGIPAYSDFENAAALCFSKGVFKITKYNHKHNYTHFSATKTKNMVMGIKNGDPFYCLMAYHDYKPLILKEAYRSHVIACLGEDAENIAWQAFFEFIHGYHGNQYRLLPGLIQKYLYFELLHKVYPRTFTSVQDEAILDLTDDAGKRLVDPAYTDTALENIHANEHVHYLLGCLSAKQKDIILATVIGHETLDTYSKRNGIAFTVAFLRQKAALKKMHHLLQTE